MYIPFLIQHVIQWHICVMLMVCVAGELSPSCG